MYKECLYQNMLFKFIRIFFSLLAFSLWFVISFFLPYILQLLIAKGIGILIFKSKLSRKKIALTNIQKCFPNLTQREQDNLLKRNLISTAYGLFESGAAWFWPNWRLKSLYEIEGLQYIKKAQSENKGVVFMGIHFTTIEIGAAFVNIEDTIDGFYRPHKNPIYEKIQAWGRTRRNNKSQVIPNGDLRAIVRALRKGRAVNYAPDQDYGRKRSIFVPFFGVSTATVKATTHLAKAGRADVIPWICVRTADTGRYKIKIYPPITEQLNQGDKEDALTINRFIEQRILEYPEQYLWVHKRFKTRPENEESFYV